MVHGAIHFVLTGVGVPGAGNLWPGGQMLEEGDQRDCGHQDPEEPSQLCQTGTDRGLHPLQAQVNTHSPFTTVQRNVTALSLRTVSFLQTSHFCSFSTKTSNVTSISFLHRIRHFCIILTTTIHHFRFLPPPASLPYLFNTGTTALPYFFLY
jgi:hypothetical protein